MTIDPTPETKPKPGFSRYPTSSTRPPTPTPLVSSRPDKKAKGEPLTIPADIIGRIAKLAENTTRAKLLRLSWAT
ncbi:hypothetical protein IAT40_006370 [Kwoniella sp. CBS 6097]